ncbi:hypothetical protein JCM30237_20250 [Halolamina litorea]|uniref:Uncharacterized protein n=1 Tax=Halolamina litorea TaxID=1515593 RepID=A0ABD6BTC3_9EURY|nr:hypothetical protein [Halolamina litorea]
MERRPFLVGTASVLAATAGCVGDAPTTPDDGPAATDTDTPPMSPPTITDRSFEPRENCPEPGSATVSTDDARVIVEGCIVGRNGCMVASLASATYDAVADELSVRVTTVDESEPDEMCTQQLVHRGYRAEIRFDGGLPATTVVTHDGADGEREVARTEHGD